MLQFSSSDNGTGREQTGHVKLNQLKQELTLTVHSEYGPVSLVFHMIAELFHS
jgi:hypothetical protein